MTLLHKSLIMLVLVVVLAVVPLMLNPQADFGGADGKAEEAIGEINSSYQPWVESLWIPSGETESLLFALQASLGAGFIGYYIGLKRGQTKARSKD